ncbi:hypothetical protein BN946_scf185028.g2 [Trametes cinnabarina]|uniref:Uncharacterized protein n=1 Tax=Pycnoporus cinnabarinus TaxID=5643 RepID=A0A060SRG8_PYCCI|nr:hypothetical protein BN946_scf185028.g2 [Trametes cinnabarina]
MEQLKMFLGFYVSPTGPSGWIAALLKMANAHQKGPASARSFREWTRAFLADRHALPFTAERAWQQSHIARNPELKKAIEEHLQSITNLLRYGMDKPVSLSTAQVWMHVLEYCWTKVLSSQFVDGHEHVDVMDYRQVTFLPAMALMDTSAREWDKEGNEVKPNPTAKSQLSTGGTMSQSSMQMTAT